MFGAGWFWKRASVPRNHIEQLHCGGKHDYSRHYWNRDPRVWGCAFLSPALLKYLPPFYLRHVIIERGIKPPSD